MKLKDIYNSIISAGIVADPRGAATARKKLTQEKRAYAKLKGSSKKFFDKERLYNPYSDTRLLNGQANAEIKTILVGIDMEVSEILLAERLRKNGRNVDLVFAHHPEGRALAGLPDVMHLQTDLLCGLGLERKVAEDLMRQRVQEIARRIHSSNHMRSVDAARLLGVPFLCCHTPADNHVVQYLERLMAKKNPKTLQQVIDLLLKEPEYQDAARNNAGPTILIGKPTDKVGKIVVDMTGGTEGSQEIFARLSQAGVKTLLCMHLSEGHFKKVKPEHLNVIIAGHMASDNVGVNLILDKLAKKGKLEFIECSGFRRVKR